MPLDALLYKKLVDGWQAVLPGCRFDKGHYDSGHMTLFGFDPVRRHPETLTIVLVPGFVRMHRSSPRLTPKKPTAPSHPFLQRLLPFTVQSVSLLPWERVINWTIQKSDPWEQPVSNHWMVELTGRLTNMVLTDADYQVIDGLKRFPPESSQRPIWPGHRYEVPPPAPNPCLSRRAADFPPTARIAIEALGAEFMERCCRDYEEKNLGAWYLQHAHQHDDIWVYPIAGYQATPVEDVDRAVERLFVQKEEAAERQALTRQLLKQWQDQMQHLRQKRQSLLSWLADDGQTSKDLGDLWLAYQSRFDKDTFQITVDNFAEPPVPVTLTLTPGQTPQGEANKAYREYKKAKARVLAARSMLDPIDAQIRHLDDALQRLAQTPDLAWLREQWQSEHPQQSRSPKRPSKSEPFRHFVSINGFPLLAGRSREENQRLTFQVARPNDLWFHVKQAAGSHVILSVGHQLPQPEDVLDAAHLAAFYSPCAHSSMVPVDTTERKFVRKRPHGEVGQVLYEREKTLYVTPDLERLQRLGAIKPKLTE